MKNFRILRPVENKLKISEYKSSLMKGTDLVPFNHESSNFATNICG